MNKNTANTAPDERADIVYIDIDKIRPHEKNPRKDVGDVSELAESIKANGIMQNLTVIPDGDGYKALIGHRRLAAARAAGLERVPCAIVRDMPESEQVAVMLAENMQRADLTAVEQAEGIQMMLDLGDTVSDIVQKTGMSETTVRRRVNLLQYDMEQVRAAFERGASFDDYESLKKIEDADKRAQLLTEIGTSNFNWHYKSALDEQERDKKMQPLYEWLDTWAEYIKSYNYDGTKTFVRAYTQGAAQEMPSNYDAGKKYYYTKGYSATVYVEYSEPVVSEEEKQRRAEEQRKTEERNERRGKLNDICRRMTKSRVEFWRDFERLPGKSAANKLAALSQIADIVARYNADNPYGSCDTEDFIEYIFYDVPDFDMKQDLSDWIKKQFEDMQAEKRIIFNMMNGMCISDINTYDWNCRYAPDMAASIVAEYEIMKICGYEMSDEERAMLDGSHELYVGGGEDNA